MGSRRSANIVLPEKGTLLQMTVYDVLKRK